MDHTSTGAAPVKTGKADRRADLPFLVITLTLLGVGVVMVLSASFASAYYDLQGETGHNPVYFFSRQAIFAVLGTLLGGAVYAALSPMTLREGLAISAGFGWYTMAPSVIASAGHTMASAVSFLHNVLREMLGIILLPVIAGKIGYIEAITIPGTASTDVCLPIVEQVCNSETVAYSFCTGMLMCITSAALVPIIIGA